MMDGIAGNIRLEFNFAKDSLRKKDYILVFLFPINIFCLPIIKEVITSAVDFSSTSDQGIIHLPLLLDCFLL